MKRLKELMLLTLLMCGLSVVVNAQSEDKTLYLGIGPYYNAEKIGKGFAPLVEHLSIKLNRPIELIITKTYEDLEKKIQNGEVDIGIFGAGAYVRLKKRYPQLKYLVTTQSTKGGKKRPYYFAYFISRKGSGLTKMKHLKGKSFAFVSKKSSSGYKYPMVYFKKRNQVPEEYFSKVIFAESHENVTDKIAKGEIDAGVTWDVNLWTAEEKHGRVFTRIKKLGPIVSLAVAANHELDDETCQKITYELENLPEVVFTRDLAWTGFEKLSDKDYDTVREAVSTSD